MAEGLDFVQGEATNYTEDNRKIQQREASQFLVAPIAGYSVDSDPEESNSPEENDQEHGLGSKHRKSDDTQRAGPKELEQETEEDWMTDGYKGIRTQNRIAQRQIRTYQYIVISSVSY